MSYCFKFKTKKASKFSEKEKIGLDDETMLSAVRYYHFQRNV
jgi:hypothetical protein